MADSDTLIIVGKIMIPSIMEAVSTFLPLVPVSFCMMGTITTNPKKPYTIEGIPANRSTAGYNILYNPAGQNLAINIAHIKPMGTPMTIAPAVT